MPECIDTAEDTRTAILQRLREIEDPCSVQAGRPMDIVQMGLVGELHIEAGRVSMTLVLTEPVCWFSKDLIAFARDKILQVPGVTEAEVALDAQEIWTPDRMQDPPPFLGRYPVVARAA